MKNHLKPLGAGTNILRISLVLMIAMAIYAGDALAGSKKISKQSIPGVGAEEQAFIEERAQASKQRREELKKLRQQRARELRTKRRPRRRRAR